MNIRHTVFLIVICVAGTILTRALPFLLFSGNRKMPGIISRTAAVLPPAIIAVLVIYCIKSDLLRIGFGTLASLTGICSVAAVHLWKRNTLLSIAVGTIIYMLCIRLFPGLI